MIMTFRFFLFAVTIFSLGLARAELSSTSRFLSDKIEQQIKDEVDQDDASRVEEEAGLFEGDIEMGPSEQNALAAQNDAIKFRRYHWPRGEMYYSLHRSLSTFAKRRIYQAMHHIQIHTCIRFKRYKPRSWLRWTWHHRHFVEFYRGKGCSSRIGRYFTKYKQRISIGRGCERLGTIVHETMHALGFFHEQSRQDRDRYITIFWSEIKKGKQRNFFKYPKAIGTSLRKPYDYLSVMHYGRYAFTKDRKKPTIVPKKRNAYIGQRIGLSFYDAYQINKLYKCYAHLRCRDRAHPYLCGRYIRWCRRSGKMRYHCPRTCRRCCMY